MSDGLVLTLVLAPEARPAVLRNPLLRQGGPKARTRRIETYFDTRTLEMQARGIALRLRRQADDWIQALDLGPGPAGGWIRSRSGEQAFSGRFDLSRLEDAWLRTRLESGRPRFRLDPVYESSYVRTTWRLEAPSGTSLWVHLDHGWVAAAGRREALQTLSIETAADDPQALFACAQALAARVPLIPAVAAPAETARRLLLGARPAPTRASKVELAADLPPAVAIGRVAAACLAHLLSNHAGAADTDDPEFIHQMRVATRRLRAALRLFGPVLPPDLFDEVLPQMRTLMGRLGRARDMDVLMQEIVGPSIAAMPREGGLALLLERLAEATQARRQEARSALRTAEFGQLLLRTGAALHGKEPALQGDRGDSGRPLLHFARERTEVLRRKVVRLARAASVENAEALHDLRIAVKRLRYALEFFSGLSPGRKIRRAADLLGEHQDILGQINDLVTAGSLLTACAGNRAPLCAAAAAILEHHGPRRAGLLQRVPRILEALRRLTLPTIDAGKKPAGRRVQGSAEGT